MQVGLVPIYERENSDTAVDARELHTFLEVKSDFRNWVKNRIEDCDLVENQDFVTFGKNLPQGRPTVEYVFTIEAAKHVSMIERNDKGKQARISGRCLALE